MPALWPARRLGDRDPDGLSLQERKPERGEARAPAPGPPKRGPQGRTQALAPLPEALAPPGPLAGTVPGGALGRVAQRAGAQVWSWEPGCLGSPGPAA